MAIRRIVAFLSVLVVIIGLSQLVAASWWADAVNRVVSSLWLVAFGIIALLYGGLLLIVVAERQIGLRLFVAIIGVLTLAGGVMMLVAPEFARDLVNAMIVQRSRGFQVFLVSASGLARMVIGLLILYAFVKRPVAPTANQPPAQL